jgi:hypothetical protein
VHLGDGLSIIAQAYLSAQRATAKRASHAGQNPLLLVRRLLSGEQRLHIGNNLRVKSVAAPRAGGASGQVLSGNRLRGLFERKRPCLRHSSDAEPEARAAQSGS